MAAPFIALIFADAALKGSREPPAQRLVRFTLHRLNTHWAASHSFTRARCAGVGTTPAQQPAGCSLSKSSQRVGTATPASDDDSPSAVGRGCR